MGTKSFAQHVNLPNIYTMYVKAAVLLGGTIEFGFGIIKLKENGS